MPGQEYYEGLIPSEALRKLAEHHSAPRTRHLSFYEYQLLLRAADELDRPLSRRRPSPTEVDAAWDALEQLYWTAVSPPGGEPTIEIYTVPRRLVGYVPAVDSVLAAASQLEEITAGVPSSRHVPAALIGLEAALAALLVSGGSEAEVRAAIRVYVASPSSIGRELDERTLELINRTLYQPAVAVEGSRPAFTSLQSLISGASGAVVAIAHLPHFGMFAVVETAGTIVIVRVASSVGSALADVASDLIHGAGRRLVGRVVPDSDEPERSGLAGEPKGTETTAPTPPKDKGQPKP